MSLLRRFLAIADAIPVVEIVGATIVGVAMLGCAVAAWRTFLGLYGGPRTTLATRATHEGQALLFVLVGVSFLLLTLALFAQRNRRRGSEDGRWG